MKLIIKWRYPDETEIHEHTYYDINSKSLSIHHGFLTFCEKITGETVIPKHWNWAVDHIVELEMEDE